jgi:predicted MarR family transcription regulator
MFERWTDVVAGVGVAIGLAYVMYEIDRRQKKLRDVFYVLNGEDTAIFDQLEEMVRVGLITPDHGAAT